MSPQPTDAGTGAAGAVTGIGSLSYQPFRRVRSRLVRLSAAGSQDSQPRAVSRPAASRRTCPCGSRYTARAGWHRIVAQAAPRSRRVAWSQDPSRVSPPSTRKPLAARERMVRTDPGTLSDTTVARIDRRGNPMPGPTRGLGGVECVEKAGELAAGPGPRLAAESRKASLCSAWI